MFLKTILSPVLILSASGLLLFNSCGESKPKTDIPSIDSLTPKTTVDTVDFAILPFDTSMTWITDFPKNLKATELNETDKHLIDSLMGTVVSAYNKGLLKNKGIESADSSISVIDLKAYKKQYVAVTNAKGETEVWANFFCKAIEKRIEFLDWKKTPVKVIDGGNCFFHVKLNLSQRKTYDLSVNSVGG
jgi:hypothetical protein